MKHLIFHTLTSPGMILQVSDTVVGLRVETPDEPQRWVSMASIIVFVVSFPGEVRDRWFSLLMLVGGFLLPQYVIERGWC